MDNTTAAPTTTHNVIIHGREFVVSGPTEYASFRTWTLTGPNGATYQALQHRGRYERSILQPFAPFGGRDLRIKGSAALVEVQADGTLRGVR